MNKTMRVFAVIFFILIFGGLNATLVYAETSCTVKQSDFDKLEAIQNDPSLDYYEEIRLELNLRKKLLKNTIDCATEEAITIKASVEQIELDDQGAVNLQSQLANQLDNAINYYKTQELKIDDLGLQGSKDFAKNLELWRDGNYKQAARMATNFLIWAKNQDIIETAQNRIDQIGQSVILLRLVYNEGIQNLWRGAEVEFSEAKKLNQKSRDDLMFGTPDEALATIKLSLDSLSKTYEKLFELLGSINKALALPG